MPLVTHILVSEVGRHGSQQWLGAKQHTTPLRHQCRLDVILTFSSEYLLKAEKNIISKHFTCIISLKNNIQSCRHTIIQISMIGHAPQLIIYVTFRIWICIHWRQYRSELLVLFVRAMNIAVTCLRRRDGINYSQICWDLPITRSLCFRYLDRVMKRHRFISDIRQT